PTRRLSTDGPLAVRLQTGETGTQWSGLSGFLVLSPPKGLVAHRPNPRRSRHIQEDLCNSVAFFGDRIHYPIQVPAARPVRANEAEIKCIRPRLMDTMLMGSPREAENGPGLQTGHR